MNLSEVRKKLDEIDNKIIKLIADRNKLIPFVVEYKKKNNIAQFQPWREQEIFKKISKLAEQYEVSEDVAEDIFSLIIKESHNIQKKLNKKSSKSSNIFDFKIDKFSKKLDIDITIFELFKRIYANYENIFILESLTNDIDFSKYSYCWFWPRLTIQASWDNLWINWELVKYKEENPWDFLKTNFPCDLVNWEDWFIWWLVWYNSFESYKYVEPSIEFKENKDFYDFEYGLYLEWLKYNHITNEFNYFSLIWDHSKKLLSNIDSPIDLSPFKASQISKWKNIEFQKSVEYLIENIGKWNIFQAVPSIRFDYDVSGPWLSLYESLRDKNPSPYMFLVKFEDRQIIWSSPELVASINNNKIETYPIAWTRSRWKTIQEDLDLEIELLNDEKELAEHMMLVDMARNDIWRVCKYWSVKVDKLKTIKKYSHVQHLVSFVSWILRDDINMFDAFIYSFPMWTVSWAPKIEAVKLIQEIENTPRWPYTWAVWFFSFNNQAMMAMVIRSFFISWKSAYTQAWAWIVLDSVPRREEKECEKKSMTIRSCLGES